MANFPRHWLLNSHPLNERIKTKTDALIEKGLLRQRVLSTSKQSSASQTYIDFSHNDYLGFASEPRLAKALYDGAIKYGVGSRASPLVSGYSEAHQALEKRLCELTGYQGCMLFCSGYSANSALMKTLFEQNDIVIADKLVHASIIDGLKDCKAKISRFLHNDLNSASRLIERYPQTAVITESIFSMDGDIAPMAELSALCAQHGSILIIDDAHGFGVLPAFAVNAELADIQVVTFGKALGCQGAAILASQDVIDYFVAQSRHYIYSTALSPANAYLALAAVNLAQDEPQHVAKLTHNINLFRKLSLAYQLPITDSVTAIQPMIIGDNAMTIILAKKLSERGYKVGAIRSPTVPLGQERLRITLNALHCDNDIYLFIETLTELLKANGLLKQTDMATSQPLVAK